MRAFSVFAYILVHGRHAQMLIFINRPVNASETFFPWTLRVQRDLYNICKPVISFWKHCEIFAATNVACRFILRSDIIEYVESCAWCKWIFLRALFKEKLFFGQTCFDAHKNTECFFNQSFRTFHRRKINVYIP